MAAMMPSGGSANPYHNYDADALEGDLIDPDDGTDKHLLTMSSPLLTTD